MAGTTHEHKPLLKSDNSSSGTRYASDQTDASVKDNVGICDLARRGIRECRNGVLDCDFLKTKIIDVDVIIRFVCASFV